MDERFDKKNADLGQIQTRMENENQIYKSRYESIMAMLTKLVA